MVQQYRHEKIGVPPRGWRVRTVTQKQHQVRIAFPPGPRKKGAGRVVEILHPRAENAACNRRTMNPILESILGGIAAGTAVVTTQELLERRKRKKAKPAENRKRRGNQKADDKSAAKLYESFHGRSPTEVLTMQEECVTAGTYAALGKMRGLWLEPAAGKTPYPWGRPHIEFTEADGVKLAAAPGSTQLYLIGGNQQLPLDFLASRGADTTKEFIPLGIVYAISYLTEKSFDGFRSSEYIHELGEETGERPTAFYNKRAKRIILVGGAYSIAPTDNRLGASPGIVN